MIKKWTVILIPHDRGERRSFNMSDVHVWALLSIVMLLGFTSAFLFQRSRVASQQVHQLEEQYHDLEANIDEPDFPAMYQEKLSEQEARIRAEFEHRDETLTGELGRLFDLEKEVRVITGLPTQPEASSAAGNAVQEGKGGPPDTAIAGLVYSDDERMTPPEMIYGLARPSADLILQEISIRSNSLRRLLTDMEEQRLRISATPSIWPTNESGRRINSKFGRRIDPFTKRLRNHSGVDITASYGTPIVATANGTVIFSGYHQFLGNVVKLDHGNGMESWYGHMSKRLVKKGDVVARGQVIGKVGSTGRATGAHIHYEVHVDGQRVDPKNYIGQ
jgi:murein DD-endopeptidase MepM/ murein hydrolase activator NlpD